MEKLRGMRELITTNLILFKNKQMEKETIINYLKSLAQDLIKEKAYSYEELQAIEITINIIEERKK